MDAVSLYRWLRLLEIEKIQKCAVERGHDVALKTVGCVFFSCLKKKEKKKYPPSQLILSDGCAPPSFCPDFYSSALPLLRFINKGLDAHFVPLAAASTRRLCGLGDLIGGREEVSVQGSTMKGFGW